MVQHKISEPIKTLFKRKRAYKDLELLAKKLQLDKEELVAENIKLNALFVYSQEIKELVEFKKRYEQSVVLAQILVKNISDSAHFFWVDVGKNSGVKKNMVVVYKNALLGKVIEAYPLYSKVLFITDKSCKIAVYCTKSRTIGIHEGLNREDKSRLNHVSRIDNVQEGELIISSGKGLVFPQGFALGSVVSCKQNGLYYAIEVQPCFDIRNINYCYIVQSITVKS